MKRAAVLLNTGAQARLCKANIAQDMKIAQQALLTKEFFCKYVNSMPRHIVN
jgi:hypothetical protein